MVIARYEPWNFGRLHRQIEQLFGDAYAAPAANGESATNWLPAVDVHEEPDRFVVRADLPGVEAKDISITAEKGVLTLRGQRQLEKRENPRGFERLERVEGSFVRRFTLPENVRTDDIKARHQNGVLEVSIPKQPAPEPKRVPVESTH
jgi:HSP20 family protein